MRRLLFNALPSASAAGPSLAVLAPIQDSSLPAIAAQIDSGTSCLPRFKFFAPVSRIYPASMVAGSLARDVLTQMPRRGRQPCRSQNP